jgi:hypothetical protein
MFRGLICLCPNVLCNVLDHRHVTKGCLGGGCGVCFGHEKGYDVGFLIKLP